MARFHSLDRLASYVGLVPGEHSSGDERTITGLTQRKNPYLRWILIECAWCAVRKDPALMQAFAELTKEHPREANVEQNEVIHLLTRVRDRVGPELKMGVPR